MSALKTTIAALSFAGALSLSAPLTDRIPMPGSRIAYAQTETNQEKKIDELVKNLKSEEIQKVKAAYEELKKIGPLAIPHLFAVLYDSKSNILSKKFAEFAIGQIAYANPKDYNLLKLIPDFINQLKSENARARESATAALQFIFKANPASTVLVYGKAYELTKMLFDWGDDARKAAAEVITYANEKEDVQNLIRMLKSDREKEHYAAIMLIRNGKPSVTPLIGLLKDDKVYYRTQVLVTKILGAIGDGRAVHSLMKILNESTIDNEKRNEAAKALYYISKTNQKAPELIQSVPALIQILRTEKDQPRHYVYPRDDVTKTLRIIFEANGDDPDLKKNTPALIEILRNGKKELRNAIVEILSSRKEKELNPALIEMTNDKSAERRNAAAKILGDLKDVRSLSALVGLLRDGEKYVRSTTADAIGNIVEAHPECMKEIKNLKIPSLLIKLIEDGEIYGVVGIIIKTNPKSPEAIAFIPSLEQALKRDDWSHRTQVVEIFGLIDDFQAIRILVKILDDKAVHYYDRYVQCDAVDALGRKGEVALPYLAVALQHKEPEVRKRAAELLRPVIEKNPQNPEVWKIVPLLAESLKIKVTQPEKDSFGVRYQISCALKEVMSWHPIDSNFLATARALEEVTYDEDEYTRGRASYALYTMSTRFTGDEKLPEEVMEWFRGMKKITEFGQKHFLTYKKGMGELAKKYYEATVLAKHLGITYKDDETYVNIAYALAAMGWDKVRQLYLELGIEYFARYPYELLEEVYSNRNPELAKGKPLLLVVFPKSDYNGAFYRAGDRLKTLSRFYRVIISEAGKEDDFFRHVVYAGSRYGGVDTLLIGGHGEPNKIRFGGGDSNRSYLDLEDTGELSRVRKYLVKNPMVILQSCSTGQDERSIGGLISRIFDARLFAPTEPGALSDFSLDKSGKITKVEYTVEHNEFHQGKIPWKYKPEGPQ